MRGSKQNLSPLPATLWFLQDLQICCPVTDLTSKYFRDFKHPSVYVNVSYTHKAITPKALKDLAQVVFQTVEFWSDGQVGTFCMLNNFSLFLSLVGQK